MPQPNRKAAAELYRERKGTWPTWYKPETLTDRGRALERIRGGIGDKADSIHVGLEARATAPKEPTVPTATEILKERKTGLAMRAIGGEVAAGDTLSMYKELEATPGATERLISALETPEEQKKARRMELGLEEKVRSYAPLKLEKLYDARDKLDPIVNKKKYEEFNKLIDKEAGVLSPAKLADTIEEYMVKLRDATDERAKIGTGTYDGEILSEQKDRQIKIADRIIKSYERRISELQAKQDVKKGTQIIKQLKNEFPPDRTEINTMYNDPDSGRIFINDGDNWIEIRKIQR